MLLHWSPRSPFVHKVMVALEETGLRQRVELTRSVVPTVDPEHVIYLVNPLGQIPTLVLDDGKVLYDSLVISFYLEELCGAEILLPRDGGKRIATLRRHALGNGLIEAMVAWVIERYTPADKQIPTRSQHYAVKLGKSLALIEADADLRDAHRFDLGDIAIATALAYIEFRKLQPGWASQYPKTAEWFAQVSQRPSMVAARLKDG
ncbi:MAG: glutathione S-transferase family protein [Burkholderiaceae bacterium]|nr:glutathione S-transferase family protein [Burkholderiaceae bacterium]